MAVQNDYRCSSCGSVKSFWSNEISTCHGRQMEWIPVSFFTPEWGGPKHLPHLREEPFASRSELAKYTKERGLELSPSAEKHGGARNEEHLNLGRTYSYSGARCR